MCGAAGEIIGGGGANGGYTEVVIHLHTHTYTHTHTPSYTVCLLAFAFPSRNDGIVCV